MSVAVYPILIYYADVLCIYVSSCTTYSLGFTPQREIDIVFFTDVLVGETLLKGISIK